MMLKRVTLREQSSSASVSARAVLSRCWHHVHLFRKRASGSKLTWFLVSSVECSESWRILPTLANSLSQWKHRADCLLCTAIAHLPGPKVLPGNLPCQQLPQDDAERIHVCRAVIALPCQNLWSHPPEAQAFLHESLLFAGPPRHSGLTDSTDGVKIRPTAVGKGWQKAGSSAAPCHGMRAGMQILPLICETRRLDAQQ